MFIDLQNLVVTKQCLKCECVCVCVCRSANASAKELQIGVHTLTKLGSHKTLFKRGNYNKGSSYAPLYYYSAVWLCKPCLGRAVQILVGINSKGA